ncbi:DUF4352 domain-containing protein [Weissella viridescens]|uniref:DUF4352 domain-containing protein n=1 Tax=Weissella viridescens TaxID=1629 RepID=UPI00092FA899|nr:DUF4352 domain-containing protein [Weissella viridescens]
MAKHIKDENGNTYVQKKPFYKKIWFWILAIIVVIIIGGALGGSEDKAEKSDSTSKKASSSDIDGKTFKVGDTVKYKGIEFKVNSFQFADDDPEFPALKDGNKYAIVNITITNKSDDTISYNPFDFKLDNDGNLTDFTEIRVDGNNELNSGDLKPGASVTGDLTGQAKPSDKLKLIYTGNMFENKESFSVNLNK